MANLFLFVPAYRGQISATTFEASHRIAQGLMSKNIPVAIATYSYFDIAELRNMVLSVWYDTMPNSTHILFMDDDMGYPAQMIMDMLLLDEPVVGAIYPKKSVPRQWCGSGIEAAEYRPGFIEVEAVGGGALMIRRDAVTKMIEGYPDLVRPYMTLGDMRAAGGTRTLSFFDQIVTPEGKAGEDISFCRRWRALAKVPNDPDHVVWASVAYEIQHVGPWIFSACFGKERDAEAKAKQLEATANERIGEAFAKATA